MTVHRPRQQPTKNECPRCNVLLHYSTTFFIVLILLGTICSNTIAEPADEYATDTIVPILDEQGGPAGFVETKTFHSESHHGYFGCLYSDDLCGKDEACFDDSVFGQCVASDDAEHLLQRFDSLTPEAITLLSDEVKRLAELNLDWKDGYTQCILQTILASFKTGLEYDTTLCDWAYSQPDLKSDLRNDLKVALNDFADNVLFKQTKDDADENQQLRLTDNFIAKRNADRPKYWTKRQDDKDNPDTRFSVREEEDGGLLIEPDHNGGASVGQYPSVNIDYGGGSLPRIGSYFDYIDYDKQPDQDDDDDDLHEPPPTNIDYPIIWFDDIDDFANNNGGGGGGGHPVRTSDYFYFEDPYKGLDTSAGDSKLERVRRGYETDFEEAEDNGSEDEDTSRSEDEDTSRSSESEGEFVLPVNYPSSEGGDNEFLTRHKFDFQPSDVVDYNDNDGDGFSSYDDLYDVDDVITSPAVVHLSPPGVGGQLRRREDPSDSQKLVFNRNERLDVKKPGPYWPLSDKSYFLNQIMNEPSSENQAEGQEESESAAAPLAAAGTPSDDEFFLASPFGPRIGNSSSDDEGQAEYEMPLLATPVKDKRVFTTFNTLRARGGVQPVMLPPQQQQHPDQFVHIFLKDRFNTWDQGYNLIDAMADALGLSPQALSDRLIEDHHVQFRVDPNPQDIDARRLVEHFENNHELQKRIKSEIGVDVEEASAGTKNDYNRAYMRNRTMTYQTLLLVTASVGAAVLAAVATLLIIRWRYCRRNTHGKLTCDPLDAERGKVQEEYKQLCRDWSRSSKTPGLATDQKNPKNGVSGGSGGSSGPAAGVSGSSSVVGAAAGGSPGKTATQKLQSQDSKNSNSSTSSWSEEPTSTNMDISTGHMVLAYMEDHLKNKQRLEQEWVGLCSYEAEPCATTTAFKAENKKKNRYPDKLPYDHNRVILNAVLNASNSDYINASTVSDHDPRNPSYIVTQGPLAQTVADFWQMIWEQGCVVIVMLTRLQDNGYQLCHRYWPEEGSEQYHIFEVHLVSEHVWCEDYLVRSVYLKNTRTGETRTVTQFHFRSWPAQSVPASTKALLEFRRKVNKSYRGRSCPICIHCSDGVGRTGTYVLIDMVLNRMAKGCKEIDIAATLEHIRDQRSGMVQTRPQFEFCLMAVAEEVHAILKALLP